MNQFKMNAKLSIEKFTPFGPAKLTSQIINFSAVGKFK